MYGMQQQPGGYPMQQQPGMYGMGMGAYGQQQQMSQAPPTSAAQAPPIDSSNPFGNPFS